MADLITDPGAAYNEIPIVATPTEIPSTRRFEGELNIYTQSPHPLTISIPAPIPGLYRYSVVLEWTGETT